MAYFLKKSKLKKGLYLQIYESFYDPNKKGTAHKSYRAIGYLHELIQKGIPDPINFYQHEVDKLNQEFSIKKQKEKIQQISEDSPERFLGYFPLKSINDSLGVKKFIDLMQVTSGMQFNVFSLLSSLVYARAVSPCSKSKTFHEVLPKLFESSDFSLNQIYSGLEYLGNEYEKIIEIYNHQIRNYYSFDTSHAYFDCTNFYFEIDKEDSLRKKGPSKENRHDPIVSLGLLLDAHQIPIGMRLFPGNESEKPVIRSIIDSLKERNHITGKTIRIADKGLNCAENILHALKEGDGYIFSKSIKQLPEKETLWVLLKDGYKKVTDKKGEVLYLFKECIDDFSYTVTDPYGKKKVVKLLEKRVVTFNPKLAKKKKMEIQKQVEKAKILKSYQAKKTEYGECGKYVTFQSTDKNGDATEEKITVVLNKNAIEKDLKLAGYNLLVTSELTFTASYVYSAYHNLWRIEESFRIMKSQLDARPVYLQKEETITGHFLICYLTVLFIRLIQFHILKNNYSSEDIIGFIKNFKAVKISERNYINITKNTTFIKKLAEVTNLPLTSYFLSESQIKKMLSHKF